MNQLQSLLETPFAATLGWALIHSIWQATLIALLLAFTLRCLRLRSSSLRYAVACAALLLIIALPLAGVALGPGAPGEFEQAFSAAIATVPANRVDLKLPLSIAHEPRNRLDSGPRFTTLDLRALLPWLTFVWSLGVLVCSFRLFGGWLYTRRLATFGTRQVEAEWQQRAWALCCQMRLKRPIQLLESALVGVPTAIGWLRPVILLPVSTLSGLTTKQLEAILAHELAHIRRHDYIVNLLQALVETLLFYHPAVFWVSRQIRHEREICCDDLAVEMCTDPLTYARALLELEQMRAAQPQLAMGANGGILMNRIQRLTRMQPAHTDRFAGWFAGLVVITTLVTAGVAAQIAIPSTGTALRLHQAVTASAVIQNLGQIDARANTRTAPSSSRTPGVISPVARVVAIASIEPLATTQSPSTQGATTAGGLNSSNATERAAAACRLGRMGSVEAIPALITLLSDETPIEPIRCWGGGDWSPALETLIRHSPGEHSAIALASLGQVTVDPLIAALGSTNPTTRRNAAWAIGELRGGLENDRSAAVEPLIVALADDNASVRLASAFSLGEIRPRVAINPLIAALLDVDLAVREMAASALGEMKTSAAVEGLIAVLLRDETERARRKAAWALGEIKDAGALDALSTALNDSDHWVRSSAKHAIKEIRD